MYFALSFQGDSHLGKVHFLIVPQAIHQYLWYMAYDHPMHNHTDESYCMIDYDKIKEYNTEKSWKRWVFSENQVTLTEECFTMFCLEWLCSLVLLCITGMRCNFERKWTTSRNHFILTCTSNGHYKKHYFHSDFFHLCQSIRTMGPVGSRSGRLACSFLSPSFVLFSDTLTRYSELFNAQALFLAITRRFWKSF